MVRRTIVRTYNNNGCIFDNNGCFIDNNNWLFNDYGGFFFGHVGILQDDKTHTQHSKRKGV